MRAALAITCLLLITPALARAQSGLNLYWNDCSAGNAWTSVTFACDTNAGDPVVAVMSAYPPTGLTQLAGISATTVVCFASASLPAWWQTLAGQCRPGAIGVSLDPIANPSVCPDLWQGLSVVQVIDIQQPSFGATQLRLVTDAAVPVGGEAAVAADGTEYYLGRISISRAKTTGADACDGCLIPGTFWFTQCEFKQTAGVGDYTVASPAVNVLLWWNSPYGSNPCGVPTQNRTWGAVKSLYH